VELFEQIRREHKLGGVSVRSLASKFVVHHRMVRQACTAPGAEEAEVPTTDVRTGNRFHQPDSRRDHASNDTRRDEYIIAC